MEDVFNGIVKSIYWLIWEIIKGVGFLLREITNLFYYFSGLENETGERVDLLNSLFTNETVVKAYTYLTLVGFILMLVFVAIAVIKQDYFDKEGPRSKGPIFKNLTLGFFLFLIIAPATAVILNVVSNVLEYIQVSLDGSDGNIAKILFDSSFGLEIYDVTAVPNTAQTPWNDMDFNTVYTAIAVDKTVDFKWYIFLIGGVFITWNLLQMIIDLVRRIFNVLVLYLRAPFDISTIVYDDGVKFRKWKDNMVGQLVSIISIVIGFMIFNLVVRTLPTVDEANVVGLVMVMVMMGGSLMLKDASRMIGEISGANKMYSAIYNKTDYVTNDNRTTNVGTTSSNSKLDPNAPKTVISETTKTVRYGSRKRTSGGGGTTVAASDVRINVINTPPSTPQGLQVGQPRRDSSNKEISSLRRYTTDNLRTRVSSTSGNFRKDAVGTLNVSGGSDTSIPVKSIVSSGYSLNRSGLKDRGVGKPSVSEKVTLTGETSKNYDKVSKTFANDLIMAPSRAQMSDTIINFVDAAKKEGNNFQKEAKKQEKTIAPIRKNFTEKDRVTYKNITNVQKKAQSDFNKTTERISRASTSSTINANEIIKMKEKADKQRQRLAEANRQASSFYKKYKKGE